LRHLEKIKKAINFQLILFNRFTYKNIVLYHFYLNFVINKSDIIKIIPKIIKEMARIRLEICKSYGSLVL
jgi:hypothetical protein